MRRGRAGQLLRLGDLQADRLFAEDVLARLERANRPRYVQVIGERNVDGIDVAIGEEFLIRTVGLLDAELSGHTLSASQIARGDGRDAAEMALLRGRDDLPAADLGGTQNAPTNFIHRGSPKDE